MKKALITGGSGFLGRAIANYLEERDYKAISFDRNPRPNTNDVKGDILDADALNNAMKGIDVVFHIAGVLGTSELTQSNANAVDINIKGTVNALEAASNNSVGRFFFPTKPNMWLNTYSITKKSGEDFAKMFHSLGKLDVRVLQWLNAYGPYQKLTPVRKAVPMMITEALHNHPITIWGTGEQPVDLIYTDDLARVTVAHALNDDISCETYDTGLTVRMSVNELAAMIVKMCNSSSTLEYYPMRVGEDQKAEIPMPVEPTSASINNLTEMTDIETGMKNTVRYYESLGKEEREKALAYYRELSENG